MSTADEYLSSLVIVKGYDVYVGDFAPPVSLPKTGQVLVESGYFNNRPALKREIRELMTSQRVSEIFLSA